MEPINPEPVEVSEGDGDRPEPRWWKYPIGGNCHLFHPAPWDVTAPPDAHLKFPPQPDKVVFNAGGEIEGHPAPGIDPEPAGS